MVRAEQIQHLLGTHSIRTYHHFIACVMIVQLCPNYSRKIVPNVPVPDVPSVAITGNNLVLSYLDETPPDEYKLQISTDGMHFEPFTPDVQTGTANVLWIAPPKENLFQHNLEIQSDRKIMMSGDFRGFYYFSELSKNLQINTSAKLEFINASAYPNSIKGGMEVEMPYMYNCKMMVNTPTFYEYEGMETLYAIFYNCVNLKEIDLRGISAQTAEMLSFHKNTFENCELTDLEVLAPAEWETFNGGIAYENIFVQLQELGINATFKYFEL